MPSAGMSADHNAQVSLSTDLGAFAGLLFEIGSGRLVVSGNADAVFKVEKVNKERRLIYYKKVADLKGTHPTDTAQPIGDGIRTDQVFRPVQHRPNHGGNIMNNRQSPTTTHQPLYVGQRIAFAHHVPDYGSHYSRFGSESMDPMFKQTNIEPGGFSEYIRLSPVHVRHNVVPVPDHVPDLRAMFMEPLACTLRAMDRVPLDAGQSALIVGIGPSACCLCQCCAIRA